MANTPYWKKLQDPRWQKVRLQVLERDGFKCTWCQDTTQRLDVDHIYYVAGREPWEYPLYALRTLCKECHEESKGMVPPGAWSWEAYIELEHEADKIEYLGPAFPMAVANCAKANGFTPGEMLVLLTLAINKGLIDRESMVVWREELHKTQQQLKQDGVI